MYWIEIGGEAYFEVLQNNIELVGIKIKMFKQIKVLTTLRK